MTRTTRNILHLTTLGMYTFTTYYTFNVLNVPTLSRIFVKFNPGQYKYLTIWNIIVQTVFFLICVINDWYGSNAVSPKKPPFIRKLKDYVLAAYSFPLAMFVGLTFWALMFVDRELVLPKALDPYFPWWLNHLLHTMIMVTAVIEMIISPQNYPMRLQGLTGLTLLMLIYLVWLHIIYMKSGVWVYPVMEVLSLPLRIVFFAVLLSFAMILYIAGEALHNLVWGNEYHKSHSKSK